MACDALELCLIAAKIEGLKSLLPKYGMGVLELCFNCNKKLYGILSQYRYVLVGVHWYLLVQVNIILVQVASGWHCIALSPIKLNPPLQLYWNISVSANSNENTAFGTVGGSEHTIKLQRGG